MKPRSLSATALQTAASCLKRYHAEHILYARSEPGVAALAGSAVHGALELYVQACYLQQTTEPSLDFLIDMYKLSYVSVFGNSDFKTIEYKEGVGMLKAWFARTDFGDFNVVSCEVKEFIEIPVKVNGEREVIRFNYIWDRYDRLSETVWRVTDYKSNRAGLSPEMLRDKIQARCYALVAQIKNPEATQIWVEFDMLRHDGPVGVAYSKEENVETWRWLRREAQRIVDTPDVDGNGKPVRIPETLNPECNFCVLKTTCPSVRKNIEAGGVFSFGDAKSMIDKRAQLEFQVKAAKAAMDEMDKIIVQELKEADDIDMYVTADNKMTLSQSRRREIDSDRVMMVVGPVLYKKYASGTSFRTSDFDALLKDPEVTEAMAKSLRSLVFYKIGEPRVYVRPLPAIK